MKVKNLKPGSVLSESSFFIVKSIQKDQITVIDDHANEISIG